MARRPRYKSRKATLIAFGLVVLAAVASGSTTAPTEDASLSNDQTRPDPVVDAAAEGTSTLL